VQEADLGWGQRKRPGGPSDATAAEIDLQVAAVEDNLRVSGGGSAQDALHARDELIGVEGLGDVVLGVLLERATFASDASTAEGR
jgi:hypothetical protein